MECKYCESRKKYYWRDNCGDKSPTGRLCTRHIGHSGSHVACGIKKHVVDRWNNYIKTKQGEFIEKGD
jgi:hypothetical protein